MGSLLVLELLQVGYCAGALQARELGRRLVSWLEF